MLRIQLTATVLASPAASAAALEHAQQAGDLAIDAQAWALGQLGRDDDAAGVLRRKGATRGETLADALRVAKIETETSGPRSTDARAAWQSVRRLAIDRLGRDRGDPAALEARARAEAILADDPVAARFFSREALAAGAGLPPKKDSKSVVGSKVVSNLATLTDHNAAFQQGTPIR